MLSNSSGNLEGSLLFQFPRESLPFTASLTVFGRRSYFQRERGTKANIDAAFPLLPRSPTDLSCQKGCPAWERETEGEPVIIGQVEHLCLYYTQIDTPVLIYAYLSIYRLRDLSNTFTHQYIFNYRSV